MHFSLQQTMNNNTADVYNIMNKNLSFPDSSKCTCQSLLYYLYIDKLDVMIKITMISYNISFHSCSSDANAKVWCITIVESYHVRQQFHFLRWRAREYSQKLYRMELWKLIFVWPSSSVLKMNQLSVACQH